MLKKAFFSSDWTMSMQVPRQCLSHTANVIQEQLQ